MSKEIEDQSLFVPEGRRKIGVGYHNVQDVLHASDKNVLEYIERHYGQRCGHVPMDNVDKSVVLVRQQSDAVKTQFDYISDLAGRRVEPRTEGELRQEIERSEGERPLIVPYARLPITEEGLKNKFDADVWGLPPGMVAKLKNKAEFHELIDKGEFEGIHVPDFAISNIDSLSVRGKEFLDRRVEGLYREHDMPNYRRGVVVRSAECDGNYGIGIVKQDNGNMVFIPDGNEKDARRFGMWEEALRECQNYLKKSIDVKKEGRVVVSRLLDIVDSPGMSMVVLNGEVASLGWNGQLQDRGTACVGTGTYRPKNKELEKLRDENEGGVAVATERLLRRVADQQGIDFKSIRGFANIDLMIPGAMEVELQKKRHGRPFLYTAEMNPRFTNFTDALMMMAAIEGKKQAISSIREVIGKGIQTEDKFDIPPNIEIERVRDMVYRKDGELQRRGSRLFLRMPDKGSLGMIYGGDVFVARRTLQDGITEITESKK